ncbi:MAG: ABC transporter ATP-binding protein [Deltaproteobacteria bacterium]|nr:ABC transporter ATP-binding protein [Deltaproteobacteria bacterium]
MEAQALLELTQLGKTYPSPNGPAVIVRDVNLCVRSGEFVCIIGHSGCGKSTILSIVMGLNEPTQGGAILAGREIGGPGTDRGVVFQSACLLPWLDARTNVRIAVDQVGDGLRSAERRRRADRYLELLGLGGEGDRYPAELSAGMRQRVGIARALALDPEVLLLDEPFSLLDALTRMELQDQLLALLEPGRKTVLMVTHDVDEALYLADRIVMMTSGPAATIGEILEVPFGRPRRRAEVLDHPDYYRLRDHVIGFLEGRSSLGDGSTNE